MIYITIFHGNDELPAWVKVGRSIDADRRAKKLYGLNGSLFWKSESDPLQRLEGWSFPKYAQNDRHYNAILTQISNHEDVIPEKLLIWCASQYLKPTIFCNVPRGNHRYFSGFTECFGKFKNKDEAEKFAQIILDRYKWESGQGNRPNIF